MLIFFESFWQLPLPKNKNEGKFIQLLTLGSDSKKNSAKVENLLHGFVKVQ